MLVRAAPAAAAAEVSSSIVLRRDDGDAAVSVLRLDLLAGEGDVVLTVLRRDLLAGECDAVAGVGGSGGAVSAMEGSPPSLVGGDLVVGVGLDGVAVGGGGTASAAFGGISEIGRELRAAELRRDPPNTRLTLRLNLFLVPSDPAVDSLVWFSDRSLLRAAIRSSGVAWRMRPMFSVERMRDRRCLRSVDSIYVVS